MIVKTIHGHPLPTYATLPITAHSPQKNLPKTYHIYIFLAILTNFCRSSSRINYGLISHQALKYDNCKKVGKILPKNLCCPFLWSQVYHHPSPLQSYPTPMYGVDRSSGRHSRPVRLEWEVKESKATRSSF